MIEDKYKLTELNSSKYVNRTIENIKSSGGSLILYIGKVYGGTLKTIDYCQIHDKYTFPDYSSTSFPSSPINTKIFWRSGDWNLSSCLVPVYMIELLIWRYSIYIILTWVIIEHWGQPHGYWRPKYEGAYEQAPVSRHIFSILRKDTRVGY